MASSYKSYLGLFLVGLLMGGLIGAVAESHFLARETMVHTTSTSSTSSTTSSFTSSTTQSSTTTTSQSQPLNTYCTGPSGNIIGKVGFPANTTAWLIKLMNGGVYGSVSEIDDVLLTILQPRFYTNSTFLEFAFRLQKNSYFNPEMYGGDFNASPNYLTYPVKVWIGTESGFLIMLFQILYLYGSPYGNNASRGSNQLTIFIHLANWSVGVIGDSNMQPSPDLVGDKAVLNGRPLQTNDGWYVYGTLNFLGPNQTYYVGPPTLQYPFGTAPYNSPVSFNRTQRSSFYFFNSAILGGFNGPLMTRYLFMVNMSQMPLKTGCNNIKMMFDLNTFLPNPFYYPNGTMNAMNLIDNYPSHLPNGPLNYSEYLNYTLYIP
ncbi:MAG: hypothetical protein QW514_09975 [Thermoprotei archaeon]